MHKYKKVMICLDGSEKDHTIMEHLGYQIRCGEIEVDQVLLLHVSEEHNEGESSALLVDRNNIIHFMRKKIDLYFKSIEYRLIIGEGDVVGVIINTVEQFNVNLLVLGRNLRLGISERTKEIIRKNPGSTFIVPVHYKNGYKKVVVPVDFSDDSGRVLETALLYKMKHPGVEVIPVHVCGIPEQVKKEGISHVSYFTKAEEEAKNEYHKMVSDFDKSLNVTDCSIHLDRKGNMARRIFNFALQKVADLILVGPCKKQEENCLSDEIAVFIADYSFAIPVLIYR